MTESDPLRGTCAAVSASAAADSASHAVQAALFCEAPLEPRDALSPSPRRRCYKVKENDELVDRKAVLELQRMREFEAELAAQKEAAQKVKDEASPSAKEAQPIPPSPYRVVYKTVNVRKLPVASAETISKMALGETVEMYEWDETRCWRRVHVAGQEGWMLIRSEKVGVLLQEIPRLYRVVYKTVNVRKSPVASAETIGKMTLGQTVEMFDWDETCSWRKVHVSGQEGWMLLRSDKVGILLEEIPLEALEEEEEDAG